MWDLNYISPEKNMGNLIGFVIFLLLSFMISFSWFITSSSMLATTIFVMAYYIIYMNFRDFVNVAIIFLICFLLIYASYFFEKNLKANFLQIH